MAEWWSGLVIAARKTNPRSISEPIMQPILNVCQKDDGLPTKINPDSLSECGPVKLEKFISKCREGRNFRSAIFSNMILIISDLVNMI